MTLKQYDASEREYFLQYARNINRTRRDTADELHCIEKIDIKFVAPVVVGLLLTGRYNLGNAIHATLYGLFGKQLATDLLSDERELNKLVDAINKTIEIEQAL